MLHFVCALKCEARPLIEHYRLRHIADADVFPCYSSPDNGLTLTISGPGKLNAAAATAYTHGWFNCRKTDVWLNIGIAGHRSADIGQPLLAHRIVDNGSGQTWYPQIIFTPPCSTAPLKTLDRPSTVYEETLFDMEAAGFYATASRFGTSELLQVLKVVSDNAGFPAVKPDEKFFSALIENQLPVVDRIVRIIISLSAELEVPHQIPPYYDDCLQRWHFSRYQQHVLMSLLKRWQILQPDADPIADSAEIKQGREFLTALAQRLDATNFSI